MRNDVLAMTKDDGSTTSSDYETANSLNNFFSSVFYSCNMGTGDLPDMYARNPRAQLHIRQITSAHVTSVM